MSEEKIYDVPAAVAAHAHINADKYRAMYEQSVKDPDGFWAEENIQWISS